MFQLSGFYCMWQQDEIDEIDITYPPAFLPTRMHACSLTRMYIYIEREREKKIYTQCGCMCICILYMYIYIYI